jgi:hypothetical protein
LPAVVVAEEDLVFSLTKQVNMVTQAEEGELVE